MRIKRFTAPDMRTALRMVRDEQGPDAVILSNRATADGIEVVAATDYDEALVAQALRAAAPGLDTTPAAVVRLSAQASSIAADATSALESQAVAAVTEHANTAKPAAPVTAKTAEPAVAFKSERLATTASTPVFASAAPRESLITRARAIFRIGDVPGNEEGPTLAELTAAATQSIAPAEAASKPRETATRFDEMMAAFNPPAPVAAAAAEKMEVAAEPIATACVTAERTAERETIAAPVAQNDSGVRIAPSESDADYLISLATGQVADATPAVTIAPAATLAPASRAMHAVASDNAETDPSILAMRRELATMRQLMERQMEQLSLERLRGSPARAAAFEALLGLGCDTAVAQAVAGNLDPRLAPADVHDAMLAGLVRSLRLAPGEPIEEGGVIALVGPTGAGKTTTAAKLAARFAARHRARDVALVSIDGERTGAREQLHALGRRLGVTVCDADSSDTLGRALEQLVDYPLVLVDTAGYGVRDRALLRQILWLRSSSRLRSLLVLPANAHPHDLSEIVRRYRPAAPEGAVLTKTDESGRLGAALSVLAQNELSLAYLCGGQQVPDDLDVASAGVLTDALRRQVQERRVNERTAERAAEERVLTDRAVQELALQKYPGAADNPLAIEDRHAFA